MTPKSWIVMTVIKLKIKEPKYIVGALVVRAGGGKQRVTMRTVLDMLSL